MHLLEKREKGDLYLTYSLCQSQLLRKGREVGVSFPRAFEWLQVLYLLLLNQEWF